VWGGGGGGGKESEERRLNKRGSGSAPLQCLKSLFIAKARLKKIQTRLFKKLYAAIGRKEGCGGAQPDQGFRKGKWAFRRAG